MIFAPGSHPQTGGITESLGIAGIDAGESKMAWTACASGPGGTADDPGAGMLGCWIDPNNPPAMGYLPDRQRWILSPDGKFWIGLDLASPLVPANLLRARPHGEVIAVLLEDGNHWDIPIARHLPHKWGQDATGEGIRTPKREFAEFCEQAMEIFRQVLDSDPTKLRFNTQWEFVCRALELNYRLAAPIISALELIGDKSGGRVCGATIELKLVADVEEEKKNMELAGIHGT